MVPVLSSTTPSYLVDVSSGKSSDEDWVCKFSMTESLTAPVSSSTTLSALVDVSSGESSDEGWVRKFSITESLAARV